MIQPIFVFGALRSGTTMFRLMLDAHAAISNPGELDFLFDCIVADDSRVGRWHYDLASLRANGNFNAHNLVIPEGLEGLDLLAGFLSQLAARSHGVLTINVHRNIGKILSIWPTCKIIHLLRDPRDVARSSIGMGWAGTFYHGVGHWIDSERDWDKTVHQMMPGQICEVKFEQLFGDIDGTLRRVCDFVGVEFDPAMLEYHATSTYSAPDSSLVEQWRRKASGFEVGLVELRAGPLMETRGYALDAPKLSLGWHQKAALTVKNKALVWRFGIKRFGLFVYLWEKLTRRLGLSGAHQKVAQRMQKTRLSHLK